MQDLICWSFVYENIVALWQWLVMSFMLGIKFLITSGTAFATIGLLCATIILVRVTKRRPFVICTIRRNYQYGGGLNLVIKNTGEAPAFNIKASLEPYTETPTGKKNLKFDVSVLAPDQGYLPLNALGKIENPIKFAVELSWTSNPKWGIRRSLKYIIDNSREGKGGWHEAGLDQIAEEIANLKHNKKINH